MNSSDEPQLNGVSKDNIPPTGRITTNPDTNANLNLTLDESKGAIPKRKLSKAGSKKFNNNLDDFAGEMKPNGCAKPSSTSASYLNNFAEAGPRILPEVGGCADAPAPLGANLVEGNEACATSHLDNNKKDSDSSSDDNELLSVSDDGCIYTYKADHVADLPSSFYSLDLPPIVDIWAEAADAREENNSSPEMDFLEMDFDPGPSGDADSNSESNLEIDSTLLPLDAAPPSKEPPSHLPPHPHPPTSPSLALSPPLSKPAPPPRPAPKPELKMPWHCALADRTRASKTLRAVKRHHSSKGELISPSEPLNGDHSNIQASLGKILIDEKHALLDNIERNMIWTQHEAYLKQITQVGPSACGATAVLNVLNALRLPVPTVEKLQESVNTKLRANSSPLVDYLLSRSRAGCNHRDLIAGLDKLSEQRVYSRFFAMHPERVVNLHSWLGYWIKHGAVPIATLNIQRSEGQIPDSWHHQMIFGVGAEGVFLTNPLECVDPQQLWPQLAAESVLLVRTEDVLSRWDARVDLPRLMRLADVRWAELNVVGQVAKVVRESRREARGDYVVTSHVKIPADYRAGITLVIDRGSAAFGLLRQCPELPLLQSYMAASAL